ncbi:hypothetical protein SAMN05880556_108193 [Azospirillum sp. RU38E]|nr:hypothetical protein SAMN05880556_108193 [Azospirillum sp. RU38E]SNS83556.1 hypothetical protein SAMN05880591_108193 [Azospirillum sp. RU37A]
MARYLARMLIPVGLFLYLFITQMKQGDVPVIVVVALMFPFFILGWNKVVDRFAGVP